MDHWFRIPVLDAAFEVIKYRRTNPGLSEKEVIGILLLGPSTLADLDYDTVLEVTKSYGWDVFHTAERYEEYLRKTLKRLIVLVKPPWTAGFEKGREKTISLLGKSEMQCLRSAGLYGKPLDEDGVLWWDDLFMFFRRFREEQQKATGRRGERWSFEAEARRLAAAGITQSVRLMSIEDNSVGYDVLSYDGTPENVHEIYIEAKTSEYLPYNFYVSRNEWNQAKKYPQQYFVHLWSSADRPVRVLSAAELGLHMPDDRGYGTWHRVKVQLPFETEW